MESPERLAPKQEVVRGSRSWDWASRTTTGAEARIISVLYAALKRRSSMGLQAIPRRGERWWRRRKADSSLRS